MLQFPGLCCDPGPERNGEAVLRGPADPALGFQPRLPVFPVLSPVMRGEPLSWGCHGDENDTDPVPSREPAEEGPPKRGGRGGGREAPPQWQGSQGNAGWCTRSLLWLLGSIETRRPSPGSSGGQLSCVPSQGGPHLPGTESPRQL